MGNIVGFFDSTDGPVFLVVMGLNYGLAYKRRLYSKLTDIYTKNEFLRRARRFLIPFFVIFIVGIALEAVIFRFAGRNIITLDVYTLIGFLPTRSGPGGSGAYFIALIWQFILVFPLLYVCYIRAPKRTVLLSFFMALAFDSVFAHAIVDSFVYDSCIIRFLPTIALGLWISDNIS